MPHADFNKSGNNYAWYPGKRFRNRKARKVIIYLIRNNTVLTNRETGVLFGLSESGVTQSCCRLEKKMQEGPRLSNLIKVLEGELS